MTWPCCILRSCRSLRLNRALWNRQSVLTSDYGRCTVSNENRIVLQPQICFTRVSKHCISHEPPATSTLCEGNMERGGLTTWKDRNPPTMCFWAMQYNWLEMQRLLKARISALHATQRNVCARSLLISGHRMWRAITKEAGYERHWAH